MSRVRIETVFVSDPFVQLRRGAAAMTKAISSGNFSTRVGKTLAKEALKALKENSPRPVKGTRLGSTKRGGTSIRKQWGIGTPTILENSYTVEVTPSSIRTNAPYKDPSRAVLLSIENGAKLHVMKKPYPGKPFAWTQKSRSGGTVARRFLGRLTDQNTRKVNDIYEVAKRSRRTNVFAYNIVHPGMKGFGMINQSYLHMQRLIGTFGNNLNVDLTGTLVGNTAGPIGLSSVVSPITLP